jgi:hypothetical protein
MTTKNRTLASRLTTSNVDIYTVPPAYSCTVDSILITNTTNSPVTFSLDWYNSVSATHYTIADAVTMEPKSLLQITDAFYLSNNDKIRGLCSTSNAIAISIKVSETYSL